VPFGQGFKDMSPPTKELMKLTLEEKIAHGGHPILRWMMDNIYIRTDPAGNIKADKEKSTEKIDGAVADHHGARQPGLFGCGNYYKRYKVGESSL
jgi:phage terminase large subunit-like protein